MHYRPIGVVGAITPWNWPLIIATWQIAPALRMGNTVVQKPSEYTTLCALAFIEVINEVLPEGVVVPVTGKPFPPRTVPCVGGVGGSMNFTCSWTSSPWS
jgi:acyl-CoA reductase-like NAD-dependent aldehyde dehydrogenase